MDNYLELSGTDSGSMSITSGNSVMSGSTSTSITGNTSTSITRMGAPIGEEPKKSGNRQLISRFSKFFSKCLSQIRWQIMWHEIRQIDRERNKQIRNHCNKGFHKLSTRAFIVHYKKSVWHVEYLECTVCNRFKWFATIKDKRKYLKMSSNKRKAWKNKTVEYGT